MTNISAVAAAFGLNELRGEPKLVATGEQGNVWVVATARGRWAVKQLSSSRAHERAADARTFASAAGGRVSMPQSLLLSDGSPLLDGATVGTPETWFRVMEWIDIDPSAPLSAADLGELAAAIHLVDCPTTRDVDAWFAVGADDDEWSSLLDAARAANVDWIVQLERRLPALRRLRELTTVARAGRPLVSHRDLNLSNLRRTVAGDVVVLDWDLCGPIDPRRELAVIVAQQSLTDFDGGVALYGAYVAAGGPVRLDAIDAFASVSIALDNLTNLYARRAIGEPHDDATRERLDWVFSMIDTAKAPWLEDLLDRLNAVDV